jgi:hypothetical protein
VRQAGDGVFQPAGAAAATYVNLGRRLRFTQQAPRSDGSVEELEVPPCEPGDALPDGDDVCFVTLVGDERSDFCTEAGFNLELRFVRREGVPAP